MGCVIVATWNSWFGQHRESPKGAQRVLKGAAVSWVEGPGTVGAVREHGLEELVDELWQVLVDVVRQQHGDVRVQEDGHDQQPDQQRQERSQPPAIARLPPPACTAALDAEQGGAALSSQSH